ncbi:hypothetical protein ABPG74_019311 [Tetrahymena malaccensis]
MTKNSQNKNQIIFTEEQMELISELVNKGFAMIMKKASKERKIDNPIKNLESKTNQKDSDRLKYLTKPCNGGGRLHQKIEPYTQCWIKQDEELKTSQKNGKTGKRKSESYILEEMNIQQKLNQNKIIYNIKIHSNTNSKELISIRNYPSQLDNEWSEVIQGGKNNKNYQKIHFIIIQNKLFSFFK